MDEMDMADHEIGRQTERADKLRALIEKRANPSISVSG